MAALRRKHDPELARFPVRQYDDEAEALRMAAALTALAILDPKLATKN